MNGMEGIEENTSLQWRKMMDSAENKQAAAIIIRDLFLDVCPSVTLLGPLVGSLVGWYDVCDDGLSDESTTPYEQKAGRPFT